MAASLHVNSTNDGRISHNYRMPSHPKRSNPGDPSLHFRSPSPQNISRPAKRRHSTPHLSTVRFHDHKTPPINRRLRNYHPEIRSIAASRDRLAKTHRRSRSLVKRPQSDESLSPLGSPMTTMNSISPIAKRNLRSIAETSTSDIPPRPNPHRHEDGYLSDQETWSETSYKILPHDSCKCCHRLFNCHCCDYYYNYPFCCWILCLFLAIIVVVVVCLIVAFVPVR